MLYVTEERTIRLPLQTFLLYYLVDTLNQKLFFYNQDIFSQDIPISNSIKQKLFFKNGNFLFWLLADTTTLEERAKQSHNFIEQEG